MLVARGLHVLLAGFLERLELRDVIEQGVELHVGELRPGESGFDVGACGLELLDLMLLGLDPLLASVGRQPFDDVVETGRSEVGVAGRLVFGHGSASGVAASERVDEVVDAGCRPAEGPATAGHARVAVTGGVDLGALTFEARREVGDGLVEAGHGGGQLGSRRCQRRRTLTQLGEPGRTHGDVSLCPHRLGQALRGCLGRLGGPLDAKPACPGRELTYLGPGHGQLVDSRGGELTQPRDPGLFGDDLSGGDRIVGGARRLRVLDRATHRAGFPRNEGQAELTGDVVDAPLPQMGQR